MCVRKMLIAWKEVEGRLCWCAIIFMLYPPGWLQDGDAHSLRGTLPLPNGATEGDGVSHLPGWDQDPGEGGACEGASNHLLEPGVVLQPTALAHLPAIAPPLGLPTKERGAKEGMEEWE